MSLAKDAIPAFDDVRTAAERLDGIAVRTPLLRSAVLDEMTGGTVFLKPETLQRTGSFKFRGAFNAIASMDAASRRRGVVACSSGNHAQGIAAAAAHFGIPATIVMPKDAPALKRERTRAHGADVVLYDRATENREAIAAGIVEETGAEFVSPYDDARVISGQGTAGMEIAGQVADAGARLDTVLVPCGGGGLTAGVSLAIKALSPETDIVTVEPEAFDDTARSFVSGSRERNPALSGSICDALLSLQPGELTFQVNRKLVSRGVSVSDGEALAAVAFAWRDLKLVVEPGGAVALAAIMTGKVDTGGKTLAVVLSGGNADPGLYGRALAGDG